MSPRVVGVGGRWAWSVTANRSACIDEAWCRGDEMNRSAGSDGYPVSRPVSGECVSTAQFWHVSHAVLADT